MFYKCIYFLPFCGIHAFFPQPLLMGPNGKYHASKNILPMWSFNCHLLFFSCLPMKANIFCFVLKRGLPLSLLVCQKRKQNCFPAKPKSVTYRLKKLVRFKINTDRPENKSTEIKFPKRPAWVYIANASSHLWKESLWIILFKSTSHKEFRTRSYRYIFSYLAGANGSFRGPCWD